MKKLKLKLDGIKEMLTKEQMKKISGGYDPVDNDQYCIAFNCGSNCPTDRCGCVDMEDGFTCLGN